MKLAMKALVDNVVNLCVESSELRVPTEKYMVVRFRAAYVRCGLLEKGSLQYFKIRCMQRRSNQTEPLIQLTNDQLREVERTNRANRARQRLEVMNDDLINDPQGVNDQLDAAAQAAQILALREELQLLRAQQQQQQQQRQQQQQQPRAQAPPPGQPARTIGDNDTPHQFYQNRAAICPPEIQRQDYEIKPQMIALVKQHCFHGLPAENPMDHIENFEEICGTSRSNGVPADYVKCKLFPFSLADKAQRWLKSLPPASFRSWTECRAGFLDHFYTKSKTAALRNKILNFQQLMGESFCEAWERFREYRRECPHHGYSDEQLLNIFYDGVEWDYKNALNAASNGNFMIQSTAGAYELIENLAASSSIRSAEYDRSRKVSSTESQKIEELTAQVKLLMQANQRGVQLVEDGSEAIQFQEVAEVSDGDCQDVNYIGGQGFGQNRGFNQNYRNHPNLSYRSTNVENPQDQVYPPQAAAQYQQKSSFSNQGFQKPFSGGYQQKQPFTNSYQAPAANFQASQAQAPGPQDDLKSMMQQLLAQQQKSTMELNVKVDSMYSDLNGKFDAVHTHLKMLDTQVAQTAEAVKRQQGAFPAKGEQNPKSGNNTNCSRAHVSYVGDKEKGLESRLEFMLQRVLDGQSKNSQEIADISWRLEDLSQEFHEFKAKGAAVCSSHSTVPTGDRETKGDQLTTSPMIGIITPAPLKYLPKLQDPGKFVIPCSISGVSFEDSLCDTGSTVNLMSSEMVKRLGITNIGQSRMTLELADASITDSKGCIENLQVRVGKSYMPVDFQIVEIGAGSSMPLILGRPFLATAGAILDFPNKTLCLSRVDKDVFYDAVTSDDSKKCRSYVAENGKSLSMPRRDNLKEKGKTLPKPFDMVKELITPELKAKGDDAVREMMSWVLMPSNDSNPAPPHPDPPLDHVINA